jgi:hypothetical protein
VHLLAAPAAPAHTTATYRSASPDCSRAQHTSPAKCAHGQPLNAPQRPEIAGQTPAKAGLLRPSSF